MCPPANNFGLQEENISISQPLISKTGWGSTERKRETYGQTEREIWREDAVIYEKGDKSLIDADHVELHAKCVAI